MPDENRPKHTHTQRSYTAKERLILDHALTLLIETGDSGLSMRKLADSANMRLSNLQYYYKTRDALLSAMAFQYFEKCTADLVVLTEHTESASLRERVHHVILAGLAHEQEVSDMCRAFREIWAISSRNAILEQCLTDYYRSFSTIIVDFALQHEVDDASRQKFTSLLVPYFEGYSVTARALPLRREDVATMLTDLVLSIVKKGAT